MKPTLRIFYFSGILYAVTAALALLATAHHIASPEQAGLVRPLEITLENGLIFAAVFVLFTFVMIRFVRAARVSLSMLLSVALIAGAQFIFSVWLPTTESIIAAVAVVVLLRLLPLVIIHNGAIMLGIAGIAGILGLSITPLIACGLLAALSIYDVISVYRTRHMVALAGRMVEAGAIFGFLIPATLGGFLVRRDTAMQSRSVMMLGSGDIGLPLILATSAASQSIAVAGVVILFSLIGVLIMQRLFARQQESAPMAALPPIALSAILGYMTALLMGI
jgi:presenilin-like A22 family membrane protease